MNVKWVPSHVGIPHNEQADRLAKKGASGCAGSLRGIALSESEHSSKVREEALKDWRRGMVHDWYKGKVPGELLHITLDRKRSTMLSRLRSGHLRPLTYVNGCKTFPICTRCDGEQATAGHILECCGATPDELFKNPIKTLNLIGQRNLHGLL